MVSREARPKRLDLSNEDSAASERGLIDAEELQMVYLSAIYHILFVVITRQLRSPTGGKPR
jgi:hypothetical protein